MKAATRSSTSWIGILLINALVWRTVAAPNPCYFPNGDTASNYVPCSPTGDGGCCASGDFCTSLGYCISNSKGYHYRGACTDSNWINPSCPDYCLTGTNSGNSSAVNVIACDAASTSGSWCCAYDGNCCSSSTYVPSFGTIFAEPGSSSTSTSSSPTSSSSSISTSTGTSGTPTCTPTPLVCATSGTAAAQTSIPAIAEKTNHLGAIVGAAVGIPLGLIALAGLVLFFRERSKRKRLETQTPENTIMSMDHKYYGPPNSQGGMMGPHTGQMDTPMSPTPTKRYELGTNRMAELPSSHVIDG